MGSKGFDKKKFAVFYLQLFLKDYSRGKDILETYKNLISTLDADTKPENLEDNKKRRKIIEHCRDLFKDVSLKKVVDDEIASYKGTNPNESQIAKNLLLVFSKKFLGLDKRTYDMSQLATKNMLRIVKNADGNVSKVVTYVSFEDWKKKRDKENADKHTLNGEKKKETLKPPEITLLDRYGNPIHIKFEGCLVYTTQSSNEYIYKHLITKTVDDKPISRSVYSSIDILALEYDKELCDAIVSELLSENNITRSNADGYIGEISRQKISTLEPGDETFNPPFYTYVISKSKSVPGTNLVLNYDGERIEAIQALNKKDALKKVSESKLNSKTKSPEQSSEGGR